MSPDELRKLMHRFRVSSEKLGKAIGVHPVTVRRWRSGARHPGRDDAQRIIGFFRELAGEQTPTIDPTEMVPAPIEHRIKTEPRVGPRPRAKRAVPANAGLVAAINGLVAVLALRRGADPLPRPDPVPTSRPQPLSRFHQQNHGLHARPLAQSPAAWQHQIIDAMPLGPPSEPFSEPMGPRCRWPHTDAPGAPSGPCEQLAAPGLPYCALHWRQHLRQRRGF